ncbi:MAG TPA: alpha-amylase family glycosyl hydrolase [Kiritimatiellia bacterium]|nr:alpha-amylase family glycosyl hydrolase [Kiritimatiellia bacterium]HMO98252.1 alpha-amylase family glycosyl hydrolase [Kiritimatiellia bacterium]HMP96597.1 alpha-amylase family glycosyl hydrolase [Kiritimatiellia bacterium]
MKTWIPSAITYQINLRSLACREPRNAFEAAREKPLTESPLAYLTRNLPIIRRLGANVLYFMPPYPIGHAFRKGIGSPYSIRNFKAIEPEYGTLEEMKDLVRRAHKLGFKVIFDITPNHTSRDHVWITEHPEYYVKRENGEVFYDCDWSDTAKLDYTQPGLRQAMQDIYDYWLSFLGTDDQGQPDGVDGFRLDMAHFINDKSFWNDAMPVLKQKHASRQLLFLAECYGLHNNLDLFDRGINAAYDDDFYKNCQYLYGVTEDTYASRIVPEDGLENNHDYRDRYEAFKTGGIAAAFETALMNYESRISGENAPYVARYTDNHDEGRGMYLFGEGAVRAVNALIFLAPHTLPFLLTGEEFGYLNRPPIHDRMNPIGKRRRLINADGNVRGQESVEFEGNVGLRDFAARQDLYKFFQDLIRLRHKHPALTKGAFALWNAGEICPPDQRAVIAFTRTHRQTTLLCAVNLGPEDRRLENAEALRQGEAVYGKLHGDVLPAFSAVVVAVR